MAEPIRVFVVDDHPVVREGIRRSLELEEDIATVGEAGSAEECLATLDAMIVDVVMMDIRLPGMDGIEATQQLKVAHPNVKVIILSSFWDGYVPQAVEAHADGYVLKTASRRVLAAAVVQVVGGRFYLDPTLGDRLPEIFPTRSSVQLTSRERDILRLFADGKSSTETVTILSVHRSTLGRDLSSIFDKLDVKDRTHAVAEALRRGLI